MAPCSPRHSTSSSSDPAHPAAGRPSGWRKPGSKSRSSTAGACRRDAAFSEHKRRFELKYRDRAQRDDPPHAAGPEGLLRVHGIQLRLVRQRSGGAVHDARRQAIQLAGPAARDRRTHQRLGATELSAERSRLQGQVLRRVRRRLAARYTDLAPYYDIVEEYVGISGQAEGVAELPDGQFQPAMPMTCAETQLRTRVKQKLGRTVTIGRIGEPHQADQRPRRLPLLRPLRARVRHALVLQLRVHDRRRRAQERQLHADPERDGLQGAGGSGHQPGDRRPLHRSQHARSQGSPARRWSCCARRRSSPCASC